MSQNLQGPAVMGAQVPWAPVPAVGTCWGRAGTWGPGEATASPRWVTLGWERASGLVMGCLNSAV